MVNKILLGIDYYGSLETSNDDMVSISFLGLKMLVLDAVAFGSFI